MNVALEMLVLDVLAIFLFAIFFIWASKRSKLWKALNGNLGAGFASYFRQLFGGTSRGESKPGEPQKDKNSTV